MGSFGKGNAKVIWSGGGMSMSLAVRPDGQVVEAKVGRIGGFFAASLADEQVEAGEGWPGLVEAVLVEAAGGEW